MDKVAQQSRKGVFATIADTVLDLSTAASALAFLFLILVVSLSAPHACSTCTLSNLPACSCDFDAIREAVATAALTLSESVMRSDPYSYPRGSPDTVPIGESYDFVIVGSGLAGSTLASSLHSRDPTASILILEAGSCSAIPSPIPSLPAPISGSFLWEGPVSRAKVCGGATALKGGAVARSIAPVSGMWGDSVWRHHMSKAAKMHNTASHVPVESDITRAFSSASSSLSPPPSSSSTSGRIRTSGTVPAATSPRGLRISASQRIIAPAMRSKLGDAVTLASNAHVTRILFEAGGAVSGVEVVRGTPKCALCAIHCGLCGSVEGGGQTQTVKASREVLLSAGAVGTAHLLLLSGIGPAPELAKFGVPLVANLPVGETLSDAVVAPMEFDQAGSAGAPLTADTLLNRLAYLVTRQGPMGKQPPQAVSWKEDGSASPQPLVRVSSDPFANRVKVEASVVSPSGQGTVKLTSSDPTSPPAVSMDPRSNADDMMALVEAVKMGHYITIAEGMKHLLGPRSDPGGVCPNPVEGRCQQYDVKHMARAAGQRAATTPMGRVVDESLSVMGGVRGLRVVDTAAALSSCGGSDEWCSAAIAEKAAELIALTWSGKRQ